jgi:hypothetical protein
MPDTTGATGAEDSTEKAVAANAKASEERNDAANKTASNKAAKAKRQADDEFDTIDRRVHLHTVPVHPTVLDGQGVERIVGAPLDASWTPAPSEPDPREVERLKSLQAKLEERKQDRLDALTASPKES